MNIMNILSGSWVADFIENIFNLCSEDESKSYRFGLEWHDMGVSN